MDGWTKWRVELSSMWLKMKYAVKYSKWQRKTQKGSSSDRTFFFCFHFSGEPLLEGGQRSILGGIWDFIGINEIIETVKDTIGGKKNRQRMNSGIYCSTNLIGHSDTPAGKR